MSMVSTGLKLWGVLSATKELAKNRPEQQHLLFIRLSV